MPEIRFQVGGVRAGSAARSAEDAARESPGPQARRVQAGSAARMAEEAKRAGENTRGSMPTLSMRAQGGKILHSEVSQTAAPGTLPYNPVPRKQEESVAQDEPELAQQKSSLFAQTTFHPAADPGRAAPPLADSLPDVNSTPGLANRFTSMLRSFFKPGDPPSIVG